MGQQRGHGDPVQQIGDIVLRVEGEEPPDRGLLQVEALVDELLPQFLRPRLGKDRRREDLDRPPQIAGFQCRHQVPGRTLPAHRDLGPKADGLTPVAADQNDPAQQFRIQHGEPDQKQHAARNPDRRRPGSPPPASASTARTSSVWSCMS